jgi:hypothetical protein
MTQPENMVWGHYLQPVACGLTLYLGAVGGVATTALRAGALRAIAETTDLLH